MEYNNTEYSKDKLLKALSTLTIFDTVIPTFTWSNDRRYALATHLRHGTVTKKEVRSILHHQLLATARRYYKLNINHGKDLELSVAEVFAYAVVHDAFTRGELRKVHFDHGETAETFTQQYFKTTLLDDLVTELTTERNACFPQGDCCCC